MWKIYDLVYALLCECVCEMRTKPTNSTFGVKTLLPNKVLSEWVRLFGSDSFAFTIFRTEMITYSRKWGRRIGFFNLQFLVRHFFFIIIILWSWIEQVLISIMPLHESNCYLMSIGENGLKMWTFFLLS